MAKQYIDVLIDGKVYSLGGSETEGYVQQIATYLNGKIFQLKAQPGFLKMPEDYQSIMTYLNLADDYFKEKESAKALASDKESMEKETYRLKHEMVSTQMKLESLRNERTVSEEELETAKKAAKEAAEQAEAAKNEVQAQIERVKKEAQEQIEAVKKTAQEQVESARKEAQGQIEAVKKTAQEQVESARKETQGQIEAVKKTAQEQVESARKEAQEQIERAKREVQARGIRGKSSPGSRCQGGADSPGAGRSCKERGIGTDCGCKEGSKRFPWRSRGLEAGGRRSASGGRVIPE